MDPTLDSLSVEQLLALKTQTAPQPSALPAQSQSYTPQSLDSLTPQELMALKSSTVNKDWNIMNSAKNFGSGVVEGTAGMVGLAADALSFGAKKTFPMSLFNDPFASPTFENSKAINDFIDPMLSEKDPQYRYSRTMGNFAAPTPIKGANTIKNFLINTVSGLGAQGAEDVTGDTKIAPLVGAIGTGAAVSSLGDLGSLLRRVFAGSSKDEIAGSAAKAFSEQTGLTTDQLSLANQQATDSLTSLQTTAERTGNAGAAQLEKTLGSTGDNAATYNALDQRRIQARESLINSGSEVSGVNKEGLGDTLISAAEDIQGKMKSNSAAFWDGVPKDETISVKNSQESLIELLGSRQAGLPIKANVENLVSQIALKKEGALTSGALQDIRSDALSLMRDKDLTGFEKKLLTQLTENIDTSMASGLSEKSYETWRAARQSTAAEKSAFGRKTAGGYLVSDNTRTSEVLDKVFKGDKQAVTELRTAIGESPEIMEQVKRGIIDKIPRDVQGNLTANNMKKFLASNESGIKELFGNAYHKDLVRIYDDLKSSAGVGSLAFLASKGNSVTAQKVTVAGAVQDLVTESLVPGTGGAFSGLINAIKQGAGLKDSKAVEDLMFKAALDPKFAETLSRAPTRRRIFNALETLQNGVKSAAKTGAIVGGKELSTREQDNRTPLARALDKVVGENLSSEPSIKETAISKLADFVGATPALADDLNNNEDQDMARSPEFDAKVNTIANNLDTDPRHLMKAMAFETGGTFDPTEKNKAGSGATGLIQFMPSTAKNLTGADTKEAAIKILEKMTATEQLDYVEKYLKPFKGKLNTVEDVYMAILWPKAVGKDSEYTLFKKGTIAYWQNRGLDVNKDGVITKDEAASKVRSIKV